MKKEIRVFALPSHTVVGRTSGVDMVRIVQPMQYLDGYEDDEVKIKVDIYNPARNRSWTYLAKKYDVVYLNYTVHDWSYAEMACLLRKENRKIIIDLDDLLWKVEPDNYAFNALRKIDTFGITRGILNDADLVTTTNKYLRNAIVDISNKPCDKVLVFPNQVDLDKNYKYPCGAKDTHEKTILHYGSTSHFEDLSESGFVAGLERIFREYPNVKFKSIGALLPRLKVKWGPRYETGYGSSDVYTWIHKHFPKYMEEADIIAIPLRNTLYNRCKSDIKLIESWSAKKPTAASNVRPYYETIENGKNGFLCANPEDWYKSFKELLDSKEKRELMGNAGYDYVVKYRQAKNHVKEYADMIKSVVLTSTS